jgi:hypothetical protein
MIKKLFISYVYHDFPDSAENFRFFVNQIKNNKNIHVVIHACSFNYFQQDEIPSEWKINKVFDNLDLNHHYKYFFNFNLEYMAYCWMNSSCVGPLIPNYVIESFEHIIFNLFKDPLIGLIAPIVETPPDDLGSRTLDEFKKIKQIQVGVPFAHSYCLFLSNIAMVALKKSNILNIEDITRDDAVHKLERQITAVVINEGLGVRSFLYKHKNVKFEDSNNWNFKLFSKSEVTCPEIEKNYYETDVNPYEVLFYKNIRHEGTHRSRENSGIPHFNKKYIENIFLEPNFDIE